MSADELRAVKTLIEIAAANSSYGCCNGIIYNYHKTAVRGCVGAPNFM